MPSAIPNAGAAGSLRTTLWQCQKEVPHSLAPRNPYWCRILTANAVSRRHMLTLISRHLVLTPIDHIAVEQDGFEALRQIGTLIARAHAALRQALSSVVGTNRTSRARLTISLPRGKPRTGRIHQYCFWTRTGHWRLDPAACGQTKSEARMRVAGPLTNTGTAPGPLGRCSDER